MVFLRREHPFEFDIIVVGSGIAGLFAALKAARFARVCLLTKEDLYNTNTWLAQGGIAAALSDDDSPKQHFDDTIRAGAGLCDAEAVKVMVEEGPRCIQELQELGVPFDQVEGQLALTREGAHSRKRIVHADGDATGRALQETLQDKVQKNSMISLREHTFVTDLLTYEGQVYGVKTLRGETFRAGAVILATGGLGRVYSVTTNPEIATGDGVAIAFRAGAEVTDMEFIQFHPTVFQTPGGEALLISEAVRGEGALLRNCRGERFMDEYHEMAELGPRDVVARAIVEQMKKQGGSYVYLDITHRHPVFLQQRFPTIYAVCRQHGLDLSKDWIPVAPAAHYAMGGVRTDLNGETTLPNLYACGEVACSGVHGANRLASNSLLESLVFAGRVVKRIGKTAKANTGNLQAKDKKERRKDTPNKISLKNTVVLKLREELRSLMFRHAGILRHEEGLLSAQRFLSKYALLLNIEPEDRALWELKNMFCVAGLMVKSALLRTESRGCHFREDYPQADPAWSARRLSWRLKNVHNAVNTVNRDKEEGQYAPLTI